MNFRALARDKDKETITDGSLILGATTVSIRTRPVHKGDSPRFHLKGDVSLKLPVEHIDWSEHPTRVHLAATQDELRTLIASGWERLT